MTKEDGQGDCFVPRNDGKSLTLLNAANNELRVDSSLRENPEEKVFYFTKCLRGFRGNLLKLVLLNNERKWTRRLLRASQ